MPNKKENQTTLTAEDLTLAARILCVRADQLRRTLEASGEAEQDISKYLQEHRKKVAILAQKLSSFSAHIREGKISPPSLRK